MPKYLLLLSLLALGACHPKESTVPAIVRAAVAQARRDSTKAARLDSTARYYRDLGQTYEDSATLYHLQSTHVKAQATAADSAALQRFFAGY
ncbi:hypothetical protein FNT36_03285 [Hymenobacter setariae]|uniref:Uncharacterized protein n=1 Tax=Hymenobacter setariae TaxID=2594794 RepID=A0A558C2U3_9BACT|nr:hypothetical protein [Hymenobacter setariae]TVT43130.1 hypothetical protein FNT36_03285 [Hymenobacter setariae]